MRKTLALFAVALVTLLAAALVGVPRKSTQRPIEPGPAVPDPVPPTQIKTAPAHSAFESGDRVRMSAALDNDRIAFDPSARSATALLLIDLNAHEARQREDAHMPTAVAVVIDRSGSMAGDKMRRAKDAAKTLVNRLSDDDQVAIVSYSSDHSLDVPLTSIRGQRARVHRVIDAIMDGGGTNLAGGLTTGLRALRTTTEPAVIKRVILLSDGNANQGLTDPDALAGVAQKARSDGITVSTLGLGLDFNEDLLTLIAQGAGGGYHYARDGNTLAKVFETELESLQTLAARSVEVGLELAPGVRVRQVYGYRTERRGERLVIPVGDMASHAHRRIMLRLDVSRDAHGRPVIPIADVSLGYSCPNGTRVAEFRDALAMAVVTTGGEREATVRPPVLEAFEAAAAADDRKKAAATYAAGDRHQAIQLLRRRALVLKQRNDRLDSPVLKGQADEIDRALHSLSRFSSDSDSGKDLVKSEKLRARQVFAY